MFPVRKTLVLCLMGASLISASAALAQEQPPAAVLQTQLTGLWMTADYPVLKESIGDDIAIGVHLENRNLPPQDVKLAVKDLPAGWTWDFSGNGTDVGAATVRPDQVVDLKLKVVPPKGVKPGDVAFQIDGQSDSQTFSIPVTLTLAAPAEAKVTLDPKLPALRGTPKSSFEFLISA
jgi:uncharacterized membrane protein